MKKQFFIFLICSLTAVSSVRATEGMWIPSLIDMFYSDMKTMGLKLKPEDIYATNKSSLKDAIVQFNGGCTAEIVSAEGLLFTNHHCGFDAIRRHSTVEKDYLKNGFWAKSRSEELACPWLRVTFVKEIRDVTKAVLEGVKPEMGQAEREERIAKNAAALESKESSANNTSAKIKPFHQGNQYFMLITQDYTDIRLVGAPPSCIGNFGGDTDNWVWPRHTGDFAVFRIYAGAQNQPAGYNEANAPFRPAHFLPVSTAPKKAGDFTMVYGFPGQTEQHLPSSKIQFYQEQERPARVAMRNVVLNILRPEMDANDTVRLQYASKQKNIANAWKKWIGQIGGLRALDAVSKKQAWESQYKAKAATRPEWQSRYGKVIDDWNAWQQAQGQSEFQRSVFIEYFTNGPEFINWVMRFYRLSNQYDALEKNGKLDGEWSKLLADAEEFFRAYRPDIDRKIYYGLSPLYAKYLPDEALPLGFRTNWEALGRQIFASSVLLQPDKFKTALPAAPSKAALEALKKDALFDFVSDMYSIYAEKINPAYIKFAEREAELQQIYVEGLLTMFPEKRHWADANSTLRITYGRIEGSAPHDGMSYTHYTTIDGIWQKYNPKDSDFSLSERFVELYRSKDFGNYTQDGKLWVCFTGSNHTTGGNSGSPVLDARGNFIGINFDRSWESTMSDFVFDPSRCRNIAVDSRYILWVIDKYGQAGHLLREMKIVSK